MTSKPTVLQLLRPLRDIAAWALVGLPAVLIFVAIIGLIPFGDGDTFGTRAQAGFYNFVNLATILLPLAAVLLSLLVEPRHPKAQLITIIALAEYGAAAFFGVIFGLLVGVINLAGFSVQAALQELLARGAWLGLLAVAGWAVYNVWRGLFHTPKPKQQPGMYGQPSYGQPGTYPGQPGYGQPPGAYHPGQPTQPQPGAPAFQPGAPGFPPGQPGAAAFPPGAPGAAAFPPGAPGQPQPTWNQQPHPYGQPPVAQPAPPWGQPAGYGNPQPSSGVPGSGPGTYGSPPPSSGAPAPGAPTSGVPSSFSAPPFPPPSSPAFPPPSSGGPSYPPPSSGGPSYPPPSSGGPSYPPPSSGGPSYPPPSSGGPAFPPPTTAFSEPTQAVPRPGHFPPASEAAPSDDHTQIVDNERLGFGPANQDPPRS